MKKEVAASGTDCLTATYVSTVPVPAWRQGLLEADDRLPGVRIRTR